MVGLHIDPCMKGIGTVHAAAIVSEIGETDQFDSALKLQSYGCKVPMIAGSGGKSHAIGMSKIRNPYLSNAVHECAVSVVTHKNEEFLGIFNREIAKGKKPTQAYIVVGRKLLYHIYSIMRNRKPYRKRLSTMREEERKSSSGTASRAYQRTVNNNLSWISPVNLI
ncbi:MAG: transposase [Thermoplasmataceae archaeon]